MSLAAARLSVCHDNAVEAIDYIFNDWLGYLLVTQLLCGLSVQNTVVVEVSHIIVRAGESHCFVVLVYSKLKYTYRIKLNALRP